MMALNYNVLHYKNTHRHAAMAVDGIIDKAVTVFYLSLFAQNKCTINLSFMHLTLLRNKTERLIWQLKNNEFHGINWSRDKKKEKKKREKNIQCIRLDG